jgi:hypothetical protein
MEDFGIGRLKGRETWQLKAKHNPARIFADAALLLAHAEAYFSWCDTHPRFKSDLVKYKGGYEIAEIPLRRPYTFDGLFGYLGVTLGYFRAAKANILEKQERGSATNFDEELLNAFAEIEARIRNEQVEGGLAGQYKESLVARLNGIADNVNQNSTGSSIVRVTVRDKETADNLDLLTDLLR